MTINVRVCVPVDLERIRQVIPLTDRECQILYVDSEGRHVAGTVACAADVLLDLLAVFDGRPNATQDAFAASVSWA